MIKRENGQAMVFSVLFLVGVLGMAALVLDVGSWFREKRQLQLTADAAALAGAQVLPGSPASATSLALQYATTNGRPITTNDVAISSAFSSNDTITVQEKSDAPGFFSKLFGINTVKVGASAAARAALPAQALYVAPMVVSKFHPMLAGTVRKTIILSASMNSRRTSSRRASALSAANVGKTAVETAMASTSGLMIISHATLRYPILPTTRNEASTTLTT